MSSVSYGSHMDAPVDHPPQRVVSMVPSVTESLFDLLLGDRLVGITDYCEFPSDGVKSLPRIGGTKNPDVARIIALRPDLVIANQEENRREDIEALRVANIPVWVTFPCTVSDAFNLLWNIMDVFDEPVMVPRVRLIEQTMDWVWRISELRVEQEACRVFTPIWIDPLMTFNSETYANDILRICGATNVFANRKRMYPSKADSVQSPSYSPISDGVSDRDVRYPRVTMEDVVVAQPDVVLLPSEPFQFTDAHVQLFAQLDIPAAHNNRIHLLDGSLLTWHGTRIAYALNTLPGILYPTEDV